VTQSRVVLPPPLRGVRAAFAALTRLPVGGFPYRSSDFVWASAHAPLVGAVVGAVTFAVFRVLAPAGIEAAALLAVGASMLVTGAFHEDGLADTADALGGGYEPERVLAILKDSRIGAFGAAALVVSIGARALLIARLEAAGVWALVVTGALARVGPVFLALSLPYVTRPETSKSADLVRVSTGHASVAAAWGLAVLVTAVATSAITTERAATLVVALVVTTAASGLVYARRAGGVTGDFLGATEQLGEIVTLVVFAWRPS
jgi:adenosylcobinamide-GDP ribazoletransferase